jgi:hypothetical protein
MAGLVEAACQHWEARRRAADQPGIDLKTPHAFSIALPRETGTPATEVAQEVGRLLGWQVYDRQLWRRSPKTWACGATCWRAWTSGGRAGLRRHWRACCRPLSRVRAALPIT